MEGTTHWWGGYTSASDTILGADVTGDVGGQTLSFSNWHFIEEGWDYGFVEALVDGEWVTVPVTDAAGATVTTNDDPHGNNEEGNGITGTSGGEYFVDEPEYVQYSATLPAGTTDVQFRYSTDAAYLDTGWFIDTATIGGDAVTLAPEGAGWIETTGIQDNNWTVQVISNCDLTPGDPSEGEIVDAEGGNWVYRYEGDQFSTDTFNTQCANGNQADFVVAVSNMPTGDLTVLDAEYDYDVVIHKKP